MAGSLPRASAYYSAPVEMFLAAGTDEVLGALAAAHTFDLEVTQRTAWQEEIEILKSALEGVPGWLYLEFDVPRLGSRIDAVVISEWAPMDTRPVTQGPSLMTLLEKTHTQEPRVGESVGRSGRRAR